MVQHIYDGLLPLTNLSQPNGLDRSSKYLEEAEILPHDCVLVVGGGPVGLSLATILSHYGVKSIVLERNETTTRWPKMDLTNVRSMELFRKLGLAEGLRRRGVSAHIQCPVLISTGLSKETPITQWQHPSVNEYRVQIAAKNDGTMPLEPYQRISQAVFEKWLKELCDKDPLIDLRFGHKVTSVEECPGGVKVTAFENKDQMRKSILSRYVIGCDGGSSIIRRSLDIPLDGGPIPGYMLLVHFKSRDLTRLHRQGRFWHIFFIGKAGLGGAIIAQNEIDTWTTHLALPLEQDPEAIGSHEAVYRVLGGLYDQYEIKIDEVLVRSTYRPNIAIAGAYSGLHGRVYLAGDAAHQNIPTGGYGMNMGIADAFDLGWKLSTVINGYGGDDLLASYEEDRRPVALVSIERSGVHMGVHMDTAKIIGDKVSSIDAETQEGDQLRHAIHEHYQSNRGENTDLGIEMGYRYKSRVTASDSLEEPKWDPAAYVPTTWPGTRAPHVFLRDGQSIFDSYGKYFTLIEFADSQHRGADLIMKAASDQWVPVKHVRLENEEHAHKIWEKRLVLVRPDGHVAWRTESVETMDEATQVVMTMAGRKFADRHITNATTERSENTAKKQVFSSIVDTVSQRSNFELERMGDFQV